MKTFWLSFVNPRKPAGHRFLGVAVVEVTEAEAHAARRLVRRQFRHAAASAFWIAAASRKARQLGCNPGGEVSCVELDVTTFPPPEDVPRGQLLSHARLMELGLLPS